MHSKSDNIEIVIYDKANKAIEKLFELLLNRYQIELQISVKVAIISLIALTCCITNVINKLESCWAIFRFPRSDNKQKNLQ